MKIQYDVIVKTRPEDGPYDFEMSAALLVANHFKTNVIFIRPYHLKSPDLNIDGMIWELKSPTGNSKNTIFNNIKTARKQSTNIIIDLRRCRLHKNKALSNIKYAYKKRRRKTGTYLIIEKSGKILDVRDLL